MNGPEAKATIVIYMLVPFMQWTGCHHKPGSMTFNLWGWPLMMNIQYSQLRAGLTG